MTSGEWLNIADYFLGDRLREGHGDRVALRLDDGTRTYAEVDRLACRYGNALRHLGVRSEDRVVIALPDDEAFVGALFGVLKIGAVAVMVNPGLPVDGLQGILDLGRAPVAVVTASMVAAFEQAAAASREPAPRLLIADRARASASEPAGGDHRARASASEPAGGDHRARASASEPAGGDMNAAGPHAAFATMDVDDELDTVATHRDDPAIWLFSGGTTGRPKAVVQRHGSYANAAERYARETMRYDADDVAIGVPKLYFGYALGAVLFFPFAVGGSAVLFADRPTPDGLFGRIARHRATVLVNVPSMIAVLVDEPSRGHDLSSLRFATSAGEALPAALYERWMRTFGVELYDGLGTAEMWHVFVTNQPGQVRPGTLGRPVAGYDVEVRDDEGRPLPAGEVGRLWVRGGSRATAYWRNMAATEQVFRGEWVVTGDLIVKDADGYVTYVGRGDDALKVKGRWLLPAEVESCLLAHDRVVECAVVGAADTDGLVKPVAFVVAASPDDALADELRHWVLDRLEPYKHPRRVIVLDDFPRTHLGKIDRGALKRRATAG
jgi:benzoate-CoA ligase family protein